jgi:hypothetical protein
MEDQQRPQRFGPSPDAKFRPDVSGSDNPPGNDTECDAHEKAELRLHERLLIRIPAIEIALSQCCPMPIALAFALKNSSNVCGSRAVTTRIASVAWKRSSPLRKYCQDVATGDESHNSNLLR